RGSDRGAAREARSGGVTDSGRRRSLLLVSYFYPPTRDTGARRPAAMAKWLSRTGWDVTVLTTRAFGRAGASGQRAPRGFGPQTARAAVVLPADGAAPPGRPREGGLAVRLRLLLGTAAPARQGDRAGAARA